MPIHDWTHVPAELFHHFHQDWSIEISRELNRGRLPDGFIALVEQRAGPVEPDVLAIETQGNGAPPSVEQSGGGVAVATAPNTHTVVRIDELSAYALRANRIVVRHHLGEIIAVIEIVSPGNKSGVHVLERFVSKTIEFLAAGIHVLVVDLFPPTPRDPRGIHQAIWDNISGGTFEFPPGKIRTLVSYEAIGEFEQTAYIEPLAVGDALPDMPLFLTRERVQNLHVPVPLESTYAATWAALPAEVRRVVEAG